MDPSVGRWNPGDAGDLTGSTALISGANSGIGFVAALELAARGAHVLLACRDAGRALRAADRIGAEVPDASVAVVPLDLSSLTSVREAAAEVTASHDRLDLLINNAGVMAVPFATSTDGFELQFAVNHLGHFALTGLVSGLLGATVGSRVVTVSSNVHRMGRLDPSGPDQVQRLSQRYRRWTAYADSKLANLLFAFELDRRLRAVGSATISVAAHPGWARTELIANGPTARAALRGHMWHLVSHHGQDAGAGALPILCAATAPDVAGGDYFGPGGPGQLYGPPVRVRATHRAYDPRAASALWALSEELTGVHYELSGAQTPTE